MEEKEVLEGNKLIAEFMGVAPVYDDEYEMYQVIQVIEDVEDEQHFFTPKEMLFHSDWNWLMEVVDKLDYLGAKVTIGRMKGDIEYIDPLNAENKVEVGIACGVKITAVYAAIVQFINWYNSNK